MALGILFDIPSICFLSGSILATISLSTFFYALVRKENRSFLWAAVGSGCFAASLILIAYRGIIPDFYSIIVSNGLPVISMLAFYEFFRRLLSALPRERFILPWVLPLQTILFMWFTYYQPSFQARILVVSCAFILVCGCVVKLLWGGAPKQRLIRNFASIPFALIMLVSLARIFYVLSGQGMEASALKSPAFALSVIFLSITGVWISLATVFVVSDQKQQQLEETALIDPLTGSMNRRALAEAAEREIARADRNGDPLSLIIADLDHFKKVNDTYGHQAGDAILTKTVDSYKEILRAEDVLARYGGEEFVVILPGSVVTEAAHVAERLRLASKTNTVVFENQPIPVTTSFGVAAYNKETAGYENLIKQADEALYKAKEQGRDRVVVFGQY